MHEHLEKETERLTRSWMRHDQGLLRDYLVAEVEDPRVNVQSILTRHYFIVALFGTRFEELVEHELRFAAVMNWARGVFEKATTAEDAPALLHALRVGADQTEAIAIPQFVLKTFASLPTMLSGVTIPNYLTEMLEHNPAEPVEIVPNEHRLGLFQRLWKRLLDEEQPAGLSVLEPACGSANDYRFIEAFGLARLIRYQGFDLCEKNIGNAQEMFPGARFEVGNVFQIEAQDRAFDYCFAHDLFEHLSIEALETTLAEVCRVTGQGLCLGFFNGHEGEEHIVRPVDDYHWNKLSVPRLRARLESEGFNVRVVHIGTLLRWRLGCGETHNPNAYTLFAERE